MRASEILRDLADLIDRASVRYTRHAPMDVEHIR
jgi:hypothetical protein